MHREKGLVSCLLSLLNSLNCVCLPITDHFFSNTSVDNMYCQQTRDTHGGYNNPRSLYLLRILGTVNIVKFEGNVIAACRQFMRNYLMRSHPISAIE